MKLFKERTFKWWEINLIKVCLLSLGILIGLYFFDGLLDLLWLWWALFVVTGVYFIVRFVRER